MATGGKVVGTAFVHDFHSEISTVDDIGPGVNHSSVGIDDGLVVVESIQIEGHGGDTHGGQPNAKDGPQGEEEVHWRMRRPKNPWAATIL